MRETPFASKNPERKGCLARLRPNAERTERSGSPILQLLSLLSSLTGLFLLDSRRFKNGYVNSSVDRIAEFNNDDLHALRSQVQREYEAFRARGLALDLTRGRAPRMHTRATMGRLPPMAQLMALGTLPTGTSDQVLPGTGVVMGGHTSAVPGIVRARTATRRQLRTAGPGPVR